MFNYNVRGENIEVTKAIRDYAEKKVSKLERFFDNAPDATAYVNLKVYPDKTAKAEVTIPLSFLVLRAEETKCVNIKQKFTVNIAKFMVMQGLMMRSSTRQVNLLAKNLS